MYCLFCLVLCIVWVYMCTELLPPGGYPIAVKYIVSYHIISERVYCLCLKNLKINHGSPSTSRSPQIRPHQSTVCYINNKFLFKRLPIEKYQRVLRTLRVFFISARQEPYGEWWIILKLLLLITWNCYFCENTWGKVVKSDTVIDVMESLYKEVLLKITKYNLIAFYLNVCNRLFNRHWNF
jgi:hypothetical protein